MNRARHHETGQLRVLVDELNVAMSLERAGGEIFRAAAQKLGDAEYQVWARAVAVEHVRRIETLSHCIGDLNGNPTQDKAPVASIVHTIETAEDVGSVLVALEGGIDELHEAYQAVIATTRSPRTLHVLQSHVRQLRRTRKWLELRVNKLAFI